MASQEAVLPDSKPKRETRTVQILVHMRESCCQSLLLGLITKTSHEP